MHKQADLKQGHRISDLNSLKNYQISMKFLLFSTLGRNYKKTKKRHSFDRGS